MNKCQNCGQLNTLESNFCRFCGANMAQLQPANQYVVAPPRPYMWKTDEFQINDKSARSTQQFQQQQLFQTNPQLKQNQAMAHQQHGFMAHNFRCPRCGTTNPPFIQRQISTAGWITFAVLLVMTFIFFWVGLLIKEDVRVCSVCGLKLS
ncbi:MAG: hypothetical protein K1X72_28000 [Pyrinomonadaceae bacterium]|nr:hypothetical protein [Pyrinomonadaceae bacterium]